MMLIFVFETILNISIENKFDVVCSFEAGIEDAVNNRSIQDTSNLLYLTFQRLEFIAAYSFKCLQVRKVNILSLKLAESIDVAGLVVTIKMSRFHLQFFCEALVAD